ncbi:hypothetical protein SLA2020_420890 [Shorea laevis]
MGLLAPTWYRQHSVTKRFNQKVSPKFYGPYRIVAKVGSVAYRLALPPKAKIHDVFHVSVLKKWVGIGTPLQDHLPPVVVDDELAVPLTILEPRLHQGQHEILVHWHGRSPAEATWEVLSEFQLRYPHFALEDKGNFKGDGVLRVYQGEEGLGVKEGDKQENTEEGIGVQEETNKKIQLGTRNVAAKEVIGITRRALLIKQVSY